MITVRNELKENNFLGLTIDGTIETDTIKPVVQLMQEAGNHTVKMMVVIKDLDMTGIAEGLKDKINAELLMLDKLDKVALVTDKTWLEVISKIENVFLTKILLKTFDLNEIEEAKKWLVN